MAIAIVLHLYGERQNGGRNSRMTQNAVGFGTQLRGEEVPWCCGAVHCGESHTCIMYTTSCLLVALSGNLMICVVPSTNCRIQYGFTLSGSGTVCVLFDTLLVN